MDPAEYEKMYYLEDTYWWFQGRKRIVAGMLEQIEVFRGGGARILDLGCGTGLMLEHLNRRNWALGLDFSPLALQYCRRRELKHLLRGDVERLPVADGAFDLVTTLDLMEHVEDDDALLAEVLRALKPGGHLVLTVPAHPFLWSDHDEALYHFRRYTRRRLQSRLARAGFKIERLSFCISFTFPVILVFRLLQRLLQKAGHPKTHLIELPRWANRLLTGSLWLEAALLRRFNLPFGVTLLAVARKKRLGE